ncbi:MAG TPA: peptidylprolyl isomerase [Acidimicrobiia bacterium]|nr:peptidylprolyl isomerase [Acidimicrobiia bacterium]
MTDRRQRQKEQRAARLEEEKKAATRKEFRRRILVALGIGLGLTAVLVLTSLLGNQPTTLPASYQAFRDQPTACGAEAPPDVEIMSFPEAEDQGLGSEPVTITINTSCGPIVLELDPASYPETVNSFVFLASEGFYDGSVFHRIASEFVIQGGDPEATGTGGPGYVVPDEFPPDDFIYEEGVVAMANAGGGTTGSQFFVVVGDDARVLNNTFNVVGRVVSGEETLDAIEAVPTSVAPGTNERSRPTETVYIESIEINR